MKCFKIISFGPSNKLNIFFFYFFFFFVQMLFLLFVSRASPFLLSLFTCYLSIFLEFFLRLSYYMGLWFWCSYIFWLFYMGLFLLGVRSIFSFFSLSIFYLLYFALFSFLFGLLSLNVGSVITLSILISTSLIFCFVFFVSSVYFCFYHTC